jgi:TolA-binding protein
MTVVDFHPEELFDRLLTGGISPAEQERLRAHLEACAVCRFEHAARRDFGTEAREIPSFSMPAVDLRPGPVSAFEPIRRRRSRALVWGLVAAGVIAASGALAAVLKPAWLTAPAPPIPRSAAVHAAPAPVALGSVREQELSDAPPQEAALPAQPTNAPHRPRNAEAHPAAAPATPEAEPPSAQELFARANRARRAAEFTRATSLYRTLQERYPGSAEAELSRVTLATLLLDRGEAAEALSGFERYLAGPSRALEVEAWVGRARALDRLGRQLEATRAWQQVLERFPQTIHARQAADRLSGSRVP